MKRRILSIVGCWSQVGVLLAIGFVLRLLVFVDLGRFGGVELGGVAGLVVPWARGCGGGVLLLGVGGGFVTPNVGVWVEGGVLVVEAVVSFC